MSRTPTVRRLPVPRRFNGTRAGLIKHLVERCGLTPKEAERIAPKKDMESPRRALTEAQIASYLRGARALDVPEGLRAVLLVLPHTGMRVAEVCGVRIDALLQTNSGRVNADIIGKGQKARRIHFGRKGTSVVRAWLQVRPPGGEYLFTGPRGGRVTPGQVQAACRALVARDPSLQGLTPHVLRHTYATHMLRTCQDPHVIQARLGHGKAGSRRLPAVTLTYLDV